MCVVVGTRLVRSMLVKVVIGQEFRTELYVGEDKGGYTVFRCGWY